MSSPNPFRIAILLCDTPIPPVLAEQGDYGSIFRELFRKSRPSDSNVEFIADAFDVRNKQEYPENIDIYDAVLLTGSAASAYENLDWINRLIEYVQYLVKKKPHIRIFGICFGHQIVARALGGECVPNGGNWEVGVTKIDLTATGKKLFGVSELNVEQMHRDHVPAVPPSFHLLGSTSIAPNHGMVQLYDGASPDSVSPADVHIFTIQGHPEFNKKITEEIVKSRHSSGILSNEIVDDFDRRSDWRNDGVDVVGKTLWKILRAARAGTKVQQ
ncbi:class I glutamine amidotransferase-like protein [Lentinus tigrinus ALCF2SS1-7]|uniref:Class I glutamine amidotransferase-like protein n=1 Tax=Lentinus tigrinus ALCF2SS1-6 TaxID=1328759 RepID=A0A5C2SPK7_9APHY|nr:class I glutamine amidotransferase-like protein [Lentinus tigrinus ALCF2SS1-6]RPD79159.1 class I glutamine amidotransferase-like protein [Lentinus tigrinus ALCF2SS1-7]